MNKDRFLELVNLHLDHEISPQESAEMEASMRANPSLHRLYRDYVRLHQGTVALFEASREGAPATSQLARDLRRAGQTGPKQSRPAAWWLPVGTFGTLAAAAFAVVVTQQSEPRQPVSAPLAKSAVPAQGTQPAQAPAATLVALPTQATAELSGFGFNQKPESLAVHQQVKFRPINKVQNQPFVFSPEWRKLQEEQEQALKLAPAQTTQPEEMTALQFKR
jgi:hypothetical protein